MLGYESDFLKIRGIKKVKRKRCCDNCGLNKRKKMFFVQGTSGSWVVNELYFCENCIDEIKEKYKFKY